MNYLNVEPENGKWYVSEGYSEPERAPLTKEKLKTILEHGAHKMILDGPFDTEKEASEAAEPMDLEHGVYIWTWKGKTGK